MTKTIRTLLIAGILSAAMGGHAAAEIPQMKLNFAHIYNPGDIWHDMADRFTKAVTERTGGKVTFNVSPGGSTGTWKEAIEQIKFGVNDVTVQSIGTLNSYHPLPGIEAFPYLIRGIDHFRSVFHGDVGKQLYDAIAEKTGFRIVGAAYRGARNLTANKAVKTLDDLEGLKLRVPGLKMYQMTWELAGANPVPLPAVEIFTGLQQGVIDGQENPLEVIARRRLDEVQKYVMLTRHVTGAMTFIFDKKRFSALPKELRTIMIEEAEKATRAATRDVLASEATLRDKLESRGMSFVELDVAPFRNAVAAIKKEFPELAEWVARIQAVQ